MTTIECLDVYRPVMEEPTFQTVLYGGSMSGKTWFAIDWLWLEGLRSPAGFSLFVMEDIASSRSDGYEPMKTRLDELGIAYSYRESPQLEITLTDGGHRVIFISSARSSGERSKEKMKKYTDAHRVVINEVTAVREEDYRMIINRMGRSYPDAQVIVTFNPVSADNWCVARWVLPFIEGKPLEPGTRVIHSTHLDNPKLADEARQRLIDEGRRNVNYHRVYELGEPGVLEGLVYQEGVEWDVVDEDSWPITQGTMCASMGVDFGYGTNAAVAGWVLDGELYVRQIVYGHAQTQEQLESAIEMGLLQIGVDYRRLPSCRCDHELDRIEHMKIAGFPRDRTIPAFKDVLLGIEQVKERRVHVHAGSRDLIKELRNYHWDDKTVSGDIDRKPYKGFDHACDALRYAIAYKPVAPAVHATVRPHPRYG